MLCFYGNKDIAKKSKKNKSLVYTPNLWLRWSFNLRYIFCNKFRKFSVTKPIIFFFTYEFETGRAFECCRCLKCLISCLCYITSLFLKYSVKLYYMLKASICVQYLIIFWYIYKSHTQILLSHAIPQNWE